MNLSYIPNKMVSCITCTLVLLIISDTYGYMSLNFEIYESKFENFSKLLYIGNETQYVIAATKNYLLKFSSDNLSKPLEIRRTGPVNDSAQCLKPDSCIEPICEVPLKGKARCTDVFVKSWATNSSHLIICYNVYQGYCEIIYLYKNFDAEAQGRAIAIVTNDVSTHSTILYYSDKVYVAIERKEEHAFSYTISIRRLPHFNIIKGEYFVDFGILGTGPHALFPLEFKGSFYIHDERIGSNNEDYIFFLLNQPDNRPNPKDGKLKVRLTRTCSRDPLFYSLIDIGLNCGNPHPETYYKVDSWHLAHVGKTLSNWFRNNTRYKDIITEEKASFDHVLFINFEVIQITDNYLVTLPMFLTCAFPMAEIMEVMDIVKNKCEDGDGSTNNNPYNKKSNEKSCSRAPFKGPQKGYCVSSDAINTHIIGDNAGEFSGLGHQIMLKDGYKGASLYVFSILENFTVALIGGSNGHMYQYEFYDDQSKELADHKLFDSPILDIKLSKNKTVAFAISDSKMATINFAMCNKATSCDSCLRLGPFCGWCIASGICSLRADCAPLIWLPYETNIDNTRCPEIKSLIAHDIREYSKEFSPDVKLSVNKLPHGFLTEKIYNLVCKYYTDSSVPVSTTNARFVSPFIICGGVLYDNLMSLPFSDNFISFNLKVFIGNNFLVQSPYSIYDCSLSNTCSKCTDNRFPCLWCILDNKCVSTKSNNCLKGYALQSNMTRQCPKIELLDQQLAFPSGYPFEITLKVKNFKLYQDMMLNFFCTESCGNNTVKAVLYKDVLICKFLNASISPLGLKNCSVSVIWNLRNSFTGLLEHYNPFSFQIFHCQNLSKRCDDCVFLPHKYRCGFCTGRAECVVDSECKEDVFINRQNMTCPSPFIEKIVPENSTFLSESVILITGRNFDFKKDDISVSISLENREHVIKCTFDDTFFISAKQFRCKIAKFSIKTGASGAFDFVYRRPKKDFVARKDFFFFDPAVYYVQPTAGPYMGGTIIKLFGRYLNVGSNRTVLFKYLNSITNCEIMENHETEISCRLKNFRKSSRLKRDTPKNNFRAIISLTFDGEDFAYSNISYMFSPNPVVTKISRDKFLPNGAQSLEVTGTNLQIINKPYLSLQCRNRKSVLKQCEHLKEHLICPLPEIENISVTTSCEILLSMEKTVIIYKGAATIYPLPNFSNVSTTKSLPSTFLSFFEKKAKDDNAVQVKFDAQDQIYFAAFDTKEIIISIGELRCRHVVVTIKSVECQLLLKEIDNYKNYIVLMNISQHFQINLGYIKFTKGGINFDTTSLVIIVVILIIPFALLIILSVFIVRCTQKRNKKRHEKQDLFTEKIDREANDILKQGFAELNDIAIQNDVNKNYLPVYSHRVYILYNLFPNTHPRLCKGSLNCTDSILNIDQYKYDINDPTSHPLLFDKQIQVFEFTVEYSRKLSKLFEDELFVLILFSFLDDDDVAESKKADIVSLLSLILTQDMSNYSKILKILIKDDYDKKKEHGDEKSMFRHSDLLSKLLSNWFIILMYDHFQNHNPGGDLLTLYFIIQSVINNGPVDFETKRSQYALNKNSLLERKLNYQKMKIKVENSDCMKLLDEQSPQIIEVPILSCDTISQVKLKIFEERYKYIPFSAWCNMDEFELAKVDKNDVCKDEKERLLEKPQTLREINRETNKYMTAEDHGIQNGDTLYLKEKFSQSEPASESHSFHMESKSNSLKTNNSVIPNSQYLNLKFSKDTQRNLPTHLLHDNGADLSLKYESACCRKKTTEQRYDHKENSSCCLIYAQVLKKRLESHIRLLFDDILDQDQVPHCVKDLFSYFNTFCSDEKVLLSFKSNSLMLRFWIHFVTNIDFLFDVPLANNIPVLECLKCIGRILMDVCSESQNHDVWLTQLFADIIKDYSPKVLCYYESVKKPEENYNEYYSSCRIEGINISLAIVILYQNYIKPIHEKFIEAIKRSNKPIDKQNKWITILKEVNNLYSPEVLFSNSNGEFRTTEC